MSMAWVAVGTTVASIGASVGLAASAEGPQYPDLAAGTKAISDFNAAHLAMRRRLEAAAQQGALLEIPGKPSTLEYFIPPQGASLGPNSTVNPPSAGVWVKAGDPRIQSGVNYQQRGNAAVPARTIDFRGLGSADVQAKIADEMAKAQLELSGKYDSQFIDENLKQQKLADPESFAAREKMSELIQKQIGDKPDRPVADLLDRQVGQELESAGEHRLTPEMRAILDNSITKALADRGGQSAGGDFESELTTGFEGERRRQAARQKSLSWLSSGATPEDVDYRREQQNLSNLSAQISGRTPQSQFGSLSAAQQGPTPFNPGNALPTLPQGQEGAYQSAVNQGVTAGAMNQGVNPWAAGISGALQLGTVAGQAGYKPLA